MTVSARARPGRNDTCPCGSGRKYKHCCLEKDEAEAAAARAKAAAAAPDAPAPADDAGPSTRKRQPRTQTQQPWKGTAAPGFAKRTRTPRKVGGG
jgi:hypothetical protein